ncbi:type 2 lanthipeptide synthetase LanM family protein [Luteimonas sp. RD2P54]|uniref:Type 2 lanthipeptide synthetase LanM family protein n=1 Tax=Luteimonas endophytica TaxID=3042023 RepID=A0ABT6J7S5_9GAMM|nr:type 2 lanthipeptide synthetase LanM family protein [Luteimonas endophytica]MDH5822864.1 type 2 lanthipeptide synthetase LanM family protein [Luteimonas endophytica]
MASAATGLDADNFSASLGCLIAPSLGELAARLVSVAGLSPAEREVILSATETSLSFVLHAKLSRLLVLELNAARVDGRLAGEDPRARWRAFLEISARPSFWEGLSVHYPTLRGRIEAIVANRCAAALEFARHWASDRRDLGGLTGGDAGELAALGFGAGDSHRRGRTVAIAECAAGRVVYKPRSLAVDNALRGFVAALRPHLPGTTIAVPAALDRGGYGWGEFIEHRHAADARELRDFYRGIGHWLAIMRLLGGSDLHAENLIACGGSAVIVDCETLFTPVAAPAQFGYGDALDRAAALLSGTVLGMGLLPGRGIGLGWRGVDTSAVGMLGGQQPEVPQPDILGVGTDEARIGMSMRAMPVARNHPSPAPALADHWPEVLAGFDAMSEVLVARDRAGELRERMEAFAGCPIRIVPRASEVYAEIGRMLWHPVSLHKPAPARERAATLLRRMAANAGFAPAEAEVIDAEIEDLLIGDIPFFTALAAPGAIEGPGGTGWRSLADPIGDAHRRWHGFDRALDRNLIRASLVSAYINDGWMPNDVSLLPAKGSGGDPEARRRRHAARIVSNLVGSAIHGDDGSVTWIAPVLGPAGWAVQPLPPDLYTGLSGVALLAAAYLRETAAGRADPVAGLDALLSATLHSLGLFQHALERNGASADGAKVRPPAPGGFTGLGSQIWTWLLLADWGMDGGEGIERAEALAGHLPHAAAADNELDILSGAAGAIVPLLELADASGQPRYADAAARIGDRLCDQADVHEGRACWRQERWPDGIGGFAHGVTGIGWALERLAMRSGDARHRRTAAAAFAFEDALFDTGEGAWRDLRNLPGGQKTAAAWCHGAVGIGLARLDLDPACAQQETVRILRRAAEATWRRGLGWNHCLCHGDLGAWELLRRAEAADALPKGCSIGELLDRILDSLDMHGASCGIARDAFIPGLLPGVGGIAYQLLRAHPDCRLPSVLLPGRY